MDNKYYISAQKLAKQLDVSTAYIYKWAKKGRIPCVRLPGGSIRFAIDTVEMLLTSASPSRSVQASSLTIERMPKVSAKKEKLWD